jgi:hypothetical protein
MESLGKPLRTVHKKAANVHPCHASLARESWAAKANSASNGAMVLRFDELPSAGSHRAPSAFQEHGRHTVHAALLLHRDVMHLVVSWKNRGVLRAYADV